MAKRKKHPAYATREHRSRIRISSETKRGIGVVCCFALAAIMFLSFFHIAGNVGDFLNEALALFFGFDRFLVPLIFILVGASLSYPERGKLTHWNYLGLFFFFLSFNAALNLFLIDREDPLTQDFRLAGGYLGQFLAILLPRFVDYWGALVMTLALLVISILLIFNTSFRSLFVVHSHVTGWLGEKWHLRLKTNPSEQEPLEELEQSYVDEERSDTTLEEENEIDLTADEDDGEPSFKALKVESHAPVETVLTTRSRREVTIPLSLLDRSNSKAKSGDIERNKEIIERTFHEFGIEVEMADTAVGPTVTQYTLRPSQGVKIARIVSLQNDLALALAAHPIRMEAPIPGKSLMGIEVPNTKVATVTLRDVIETELFHERKSPLSIPLGKDVSGAPFMIVLERMPHLLVAGATGSGKSVCLNTMIVSFLYQNGPDDLKLILVDPKRVELTAYSGIPHLLVPPITNVDDTVNALKWTVREMERRLDLLSKFGARNIDDYNARVEERMPKIVVVIDELSDLMSSSGREVEASIVRIAQMARAVGIHLILATQRPSVDVITGLIKANIPGRIAFAVASQTDSRTILDMSGAEKLLGRGDMLFTSAELSKPKRIQGAFLSSDEVERVCSFLRKNGIPDYNMAITEITKAGTVFNDLDDSDSLFEDAIQTILQGGKASTSFLQRRLRVGYARAARLMDLMEEAGVIGPGDGAKPRDVLIDEWPRAQSFKEAMPTAEDDYEEAASSKETKDKHEPAWETQVDEAWIMEKKKDDLDQSLEKP